MRPQGEDLLSGSASNSNQHKPRADRQGRRGLWDWETRNLDVEAGAVTSGKLLESIARVVGTIVGPEAVEIKIGAVGLRPSDIRFTFAKAEAEKENSVIVSTVDDWEQRG